MSAWLVFDVALTALCRIKIGSFCFTHCKLRGKGGHLEGKLSYWHKATTMFVILFQYNCAKQRLDFCLDLYCSPNPNKSKYRAANSFKL